MTARQLFSRCHLLSTNDARAISSLQLLGGSVRIPLIHVRCGHPTLDHIYQRLLELPEGEVHGPDYKEREGVDSDHYCHKQRVGQHLDSSYNELCVEEVDGLVSPLVLMSQVYQV